MSLLITPDDEVKGKMIFKRNDNLSQLKYGFKTGWLPSSYPTQFLGYERRSSATDPLLLADRNVAR